MLTEPSSKHSTSERHQPHTRHRSGRSADEDEPEPGEPADDKNDAEADAATTGHGITDEDMEQIAAFLEKSRHERSVDDLRPSTEK